MTAVFLACLGVDTVGLRLSFGITVSLAQGIGCDDALAELVWGPCWYQCGLQGAGKSFHLQQPSLFYSGLHTITFLWPPSSSLWNPSSQTDPSLFYLLNNLQKLLSLHFSKLQPSAIYIVFILLSLIVKGFLFIYITRSCLPFIHAHWAAATFLYLQKIHHA